MIFLQKNTKKAYFFAKIAKISQNRPKKVKKFKKLKKLQKNIFLTKNSIFLKEIIYFLVFNRKEPKYMIFLKKLTKIVQGSKNPKNLIFFQKTSEQKFFFEKKEFF